MTLYGLKPRFQALLRPLCRRLAEAGVTANLVTVATAVGSVAIGAIVIWFAEYPAIFLLLPVWLFARMALNAIDGMLAREFGQKSRLGFYLNELTDPISDAALYLPFAFVEPFTLGGIAAVIVLSILSEFAGVLGLAAGASRRYDGPLGKSDRAFVFGALALWIGVGAPRFAELRWIVPVVLVLLAVTIIRRVRAGLREASEGRHGGEG